MNDLIDTLLNIGVFIFIGLTIWLYLKEVPEPEGLEENKDT